MSRTILVVDDEPSILTLLQYHLEREGLRVICAPDGPSALTRALADRPDVIVLDAMLPGLSGFEVLRQLRLTTDVPIIMLTARKEETDRIAGLELGADDYVTKPFSVRELVARVKAMFRRQEAHRTAGQISYDGLTLKLDKHLVSVNGDPIPVTMKEFEILFLLMKHPGRVFTRSEIYHKVWGYEFLGDSRTVTVHIRNLRAKLSQAAHLIETVRGVGYRLKNIDPS